MGISHIVLNGLISIVAYGLLVFSVYKVYQIANEVSEIKEMVRDIKRNTDDAALGNLTRPQSPEALIRAVNSASLTLPESQPVSGSSRGK